MLMIKNMAEIMEIDRVVNDENSNVVLFFTIPPTCGAKEIRELHQALLGNNHPIEMHLAWAGQYEKNQEGLYLIHLHHNATRRRALIDIIVRKHGFQIVRTEFTGLNGIKVVRED
jgi:hypothetical protein